MKLVKIENVRPEHIIKFNNDIFIMDNDHGELCFLDAKDHGWRGLAFLDDESEYEIIGKLGITHKVVKNRLVEIPRDDNLKVGEVIGNVAFGTYLIMGITEEHYADDCQAYYHLFNNNKGMQYKPDVFAEKLELLGIYGVHYEFTNDC